MKEATGELNLTVITIAAIAALGVFFYFAIWPNIQIGMALSSACNAAGGQNYTNVLEDGSEIICNAATNSCTYNSHETGRSSTKSCG